MVNFAALKFNEMLNCSSVNYQVITANSLGNDTIINFNYLCVF